MANQPIHGNHIAYILPEDLFIEVADAQCHKLDCIQRELTNRPDVAQLEGEVNYDNLEGLEPIATQ